MNTEPPVDGPSGAPDGRLQRAVLMALPVADSRGLGASCMMPLVDRPFVQHVLEQLCEQGVERIDVLGLASDEPLQHFVCDSQRWGCQVHWLGAAHAADCEPLRASAGDDRLILASAHSLPMHDLRDSRLQGVVACLRAHGASPHLGWAVIDGQVLDCLPSGCRAEDFELWLESLVESEVVVHESFRAGTLGQLLGAQRQCLERAASRRHDRSDTLQLIGRERLCGVRVCRNVRIHRSALLEGPVFIGDNTRIGKGVRLGPNTVVGPDCIIDHHAQLSDSLVLERTYVGPWVEVHDCAVRQHEVTNVRLQAAVSVDDPLVVSGV